MLLPFTVSAQPRHPRYLSARADLRRSVLLMRIPDEPNVMRDMQAASDLVERAIRELDAAAMFDRRDLVDNPPVDTVWAAAAVFARSCACWAARATTLPRRKTIRAQPNGATGPSA